MIREAILQGAAMNRIWLSSYSPGVPAEVDVGAFASLNDLFDWICRSFGDLPAFTNQGTTVTCSSGPVHCGVGSFHAGRRDVLVA